MEKGKTETFINRENLMMRIRGKVIIEDGVTPLEARFCVETAYAATGMKTDRTSELVNQLLDKYEKLSKVVRRDQG